MQMKRKISLWILIVALLLAGCGNETGREEAGVNYNQYLTSHFSMGYSQDAYYFDDNGRVYFLEPSMTAPLSILCTKADCSHSDETCSAYIGSNNLFVAHNKLYYRKENEDGSECIYEANGKGENRRLVYEIPFRLENGMGIITRGYGDYLIMDISRMSTEGQTNQIYLANYLDSNSEAKLVFGEAEDINLSYVVIGITDEWLLVSEIDYEKNTRTLLGYEIGTGKIHRLVEGWKSDNYVSVRENQLYWFVIGEGFYSVELDTAQVHKYNSCDSILGFGPGVYDENYFYFSNAIPVELGGDRVPIEKRGIYVYDYEGNEIQFIPVTESSCNPVGLLTTKDYVFMGELTNSNELIPKWYLKKSDVLEGNGELLPVD